MNKTNDPIDDLPEYVGRLRVALSRALDQDEQLHQQIHSLTQALDALERLEANPLAPYAPSAPTEPAVADRSLKDAIVEVLRHFGGQMDIEQITENVERFGYRFRTSNTQASVTAALSQLVKSGVKPEQVRQIFITHHHADHNADYGAIVYAAWLAGARPGIEAYGPPPLASLTQLMVEQHAAATQLAASPERPRLAALIEPHQITQPGRIFEDDRVRVTAALVEHPPISPAFAYRFDAADRSIVFSGDTLPGQDLELLAQGATVLVHAVYDPQALQDEPAAPRASLANGLTAASEAGRIAANAGVATLVLTHLGDEASPSFCRQEAARYFDGEIIVGHDLQLI